MKKKKKEENAPQFRKSDWIVHEILLLICWVLFSPQSSSTSPRLLLVPSCVCSCRSMDDGVEKCKKSSKSSPQKARAEEKIKVRGFSFSSCDEPFPFSTSLVDSVLSLNDCEENKDQRTATRCWLWTMGNRGDGKRKEQIVMQRETTLDFANTLLLLLL